MRLSWPGTDAGAEPAGTESGRGDAPPAPPEPPPAPVPPPPRAEPLVEGAEVVSSTLIRSGDPGGLPSSSVSMIVDAYERLGGRLLSRLRDLREDVDADLAELRSEVASLRTAVEDVADRVQLRQMRSSIDDLRSDVAGLRRAVLEWPELERVASDVSALRAATTELQQSISPRPDLAAPAGDDGLRPALQDLHAELAEVRRAIELSAPAPPVDAADEADDDLVPPVIEELLARMTALQVALDAPPAPPPVAAPAGSTDLAALGPLVEELAELRAEMVSLRRRISLRASSTGTALSPDDLQAIAEAVTERLLQVIRPA